MRSRAPIARLLNLKIYAPYNFKEGLKAPLKWRGTFNFEFSFENSRIYVCALARTYAAFSEIDIFCNAAFKGTEQQ